MKRFWSKVKILGDDDCWEWQKAKHGLGYGAFRISHPVRMVVAHRFAWELTYGEIPIGLCVLHACDNPSCCNPKHLFLGTRTDNNRDKFAKERNKTPFVKGHKLTPVGHKRWVDTKRDEKGKFRKS